MEEPLRRIVDNAGQDGSLIVSKLRAEKKNIGYNAATGKFEGLVESGIIDADKVVHIALQNAASFAVLMLTTDAAVIEAPQMEQEEAGH